MASFNRTILMGHLTRDPAIKYTPKGTAVARITLGINHTWTDGDGNKKEEVSFVDCEAWSRTAEVIGQYLKKGNPLLVEGRLKQDSWDDKATGEKRSKLKVVIESFTFVGAKNGGQRGDAAPARSRKPAAAADAPCAGDEPPPQDDDVPF